MNGKRLGREHTLNSGEKVRMLIIMNRRTLLLKFTKKGLKVVLKIFPAKKAPL
jgi:hypothetical protein